MFPKKSLQQQQQELLDLQEVIASGGQRMPNIYHDYFRGPSSTSGLNVPQMNYGASSSQLLHSSITQPSSVHDHSLLFDATTSTSMDYASLSQRVQHNDVANLYRQPPVSDITKRRYDELIAMERDRQREWDYLTATGLGPSTARHVSDPSLLATAVSSRYLNRSNIYDSSSRIQDLLRLQEQERNREEDLLFIRERSQQNAILPSRTLGLESSDILRLQEQNRLKREYEQLLSLRQQTQLNTLATPELDVQAKLEQRYKDLTTQDRVLHRNLMSMTAAGLVSTHDTNTTASLGSLSQHSTMREDPERPSNISRHKWQKDEEEESFHSEKEPAKPKKKDAPTKELEDTAGCNHDADVLKPKPKRPLSAYNIFFQKERQKLLNLKKEGESETNTNESKPKAGDEDEDMVVEEDGSASDTKASAADTSASAPNKKLKKKKYEPHSKISFENMGKTIAQRWEAISSDESELKYYKDIAQKEQLRYRTELKEWKRHRRSYNKSH